MAHWKGWGLQLERGGGGLLNILACRTSAGEVRGGQSGTDSRVSPRSVFPCHDHSTIARTHLSLSTGVNRINVLSLGTLKIRRSFGSGGNVA